MRLYQVRATRAAYLITHDRELADDVMRTAFLKAYERIHQFDPARPFGPWFPRVVVNDALKASMSRNRHVALDPAAPAHAPRRADAGPGPEARWERAETDDEARQALAQLSPAHRARRRPPA